MRINQGTLSRAMRRTVDEFMATGDYGDVSEINEGSCDVFAEAVFSRFDFGITIGDISDAGLETLDMESLLVCDHGGEPFDRETIAARWPWIAPAEPTTWDDLDRLSHEEGFHGSSHVFLHLDGRFFDAESPDGVENFLELGFFARRIATIAKDPRNLR